MDQYEKYILIMNEGVTYDVTDVQDCVDAIIEEYQRFDVSMYDILASIAIYGFSAEDVINIYAECMRISDGDAIVHLRDEEDLDALNFFKAKEILGIH